jgi:hypothetical protein
MLCRLWPARFGWIPRAGRYCGIYLSAWPWQWCLFQLLVSWKLRPCTPRCEFFGSCAVMITAPFFCYVPIWGNGPALWRLHRKLCSMPSFFLLHLSTMLTTEAMIITSVATIFFCISFYPFHNTWRDGILVASVFLHFIVHVPFCVIRSHCRWWQLLFIAYSITYCVAGITSSLLYRTS